MDTFDHKPVHQISLAAGEKVALCRCWQSKKFPICDGMHKCLKDKNGRFPGPVIVTCEQTDKEK